MTNRTDADGWQYGIRFDFDGSVSAPWNGRTQRQRAEEATGWLRDNYPRDSFTVVRRRPGGAWEVPE